MVENYDLIVVGAGSAGLTAAEFAARAGARVALVEKHRVGGDCLWTGCVPSKALLKVAHVAHTMRHANEFGLPANNPDVKMSRIRDHLHQVGQEIYRRESPQYLRDRGVEVILGAARFTGAHTIQVAEEVLRADQFVVATGASPIVPQVKGLAGTPYVSYEQIFEIDSLPRHLAILGAGATGTELSQAFRRLGSKVTLIDIGLMPQLDSDVSEVMTGVFEREGIRLVRGLATAVEYESGVFHVHVGQDAQPIAAEVLLVAAGRRPSFAGLELQRAGVVTNAQGIETDDTLRTTARHIYAAGDCNGGFQSTHYAGWQGYQAARNALLPGHDKGVSDRVPSVIYTDPEVAQIGMSDAQAHERYGDQVESLRMDVDQIDRAVTDRALDGFIKVTRRKNGPVLGATIVAARAGEMITEFAHAIEHGWNMRQLATTFRAYPTYAMGVQRMAFGQAADDFFASVTGRFVTRLAGIEGSRGWKKQARGPGDKNE